MNATSLTLATLRTAPLSVLAAYWNAHTVPGAQIKKFQDRATAERRVGALLASLDAPVVLTTSAGASATVRPAAGAPALVTAPVSPLPSADSPAAAAPAAAPAPANTAAAADVLLYTLGDVRKVKRGAIHAAVTALAGRTFTRPEFVRACGTEVHALSHFYWAKRHGVVVPAAQA